jgi:hypothetical protein
MKSILIAILLLAFATAAAAQNSIKLFDPVAVNWSDANVLLNSNGIFRTAQVYLSCPTSGKLTSTISGPDGGNFIVDNYLMVNDTNICSGNCYGAALNPLAYLGMSAELGYEGVRPANVSRQITGSGLYTFNLIDIGQLQASSAIYLNTSCSIIPVYVPPVEDPGTPTTTEGTVCHRDNGNNGSQTLTVSGSALAAHLGHGDTAGACGQ